MSFLNQIWKDMKARKLVPVAGVLLAAIVAVPVLLSDSGSPPPPAPVPPPVASTGLPAVNETSGPSTSVPGGRSRNPFAPTSGAPTGTSTTPASSVPVTGSTGTGTTGATGPSSSGSGGSTASGSSTGGTTPPPPIPVPKPKHTIPTLSPVQSYSVSLAITKPSGGLNTLNPLARLSLLPGPSRPLAIELGVLKGGSRVLFAIQPGTEVSGKGICIPGPIDCEILSLPQAQTERLGVRSNGRMVQVALFAVTAITAVKHSSHAAALKARNQESSAGRRVLEHSSLNALSLFRYEPSVGAVVDLRNLTLRDS